MYFFVLFLLQIMNSFVLIGFFLILACSIKYAHATPVTQDTAAPDIVIKGSNSDDELESFSYKTLDTSTNALSSNIIPNEPVSEKSTRKSQNERSTQKRRRRPRHRKNSSSRSQNDCRTTTERTPPTTKPTRLYVMFPGLFISHSWGPGR